MAEKFPLFWPAAYPRCTPRRRAHFKTRAFTAAVEGIYHELRLLGAKEIIVSTNIPIRNDGLPYANPPRIEDPGVAVYFKLKGQPRSMACDKWDLVDHNAHALALTIDAMRGLDRWGASQMLDRVFQGFAALPAPEPEASWWEVLEVDRSSPIEKVEGQFRRMLKTAHPDVGGTHEAMTALNRAIAQARAEKGVQQ